MSLPQNEVVISVYGDIAEPDESLDKQQNTIFGSRITATADKSQFVGIIQYTIKLSAFGNL